MRWMCGLQESRISSLVICVVGVLKWSFNCPQVMLLYPKEMWQMHHSNTTQQLLILASVRLVRALNWRQSTARQSPGVKCVNPMVWCSTCLTVRKHHHWKVKSCYVSWCTSMLLLWASEWGQRTCLWIKIQSMKQVFSESTMEVLAKTAVDVPTDICGDLFGIGVMTGWRSSLMLRQEPCSASLASSLSDLCIPTFQRSHCGLLLCCGPAETQSACPCHLCRRTCKSACCSTKHVWKDLKLPTLVHRFEVVEW